MKFKIGQKVFHHQYGFGTITKIASVDFGGTAVWINGRFSDYSQNFQPALA